MVPQPRARERGLCGPLLRVSRSCLVLLHQCGQWRILMAFQCCLQRDLKPQNLLLSSATPGAVLKIADFGFARNLQPQVLKWIQSQSHAAEAGHHHHYSHESFFTRSQSSCLTLWCATAGSS